MYMALSSMRPCSCWKCLNKEAEPVRRGIACLMILLLLCPAIPGYCAEDDEMTIMEKILSVKKTMPDKSLFDNLPILSKKEMGMPIGAITYQWKEGRFTADVHFGANMPVTPLRDIHGRFKAISGEAEYGYLLYLPENFDPAREYPTILFLHGIGERGSNPADLIPYGPFQYILGGNELDMIIIAPQVEKENHWVEDPNEGEVDTQMKRLSLFLDQMKQKYPIDESRIYLTGLSMGGRGTYKLACYLPDTFAAVAACCGRAGVREEPYHFFYDLSKMADQPVWLIHGLADTTVDANHSLAAMDRLLSLNEEGNFRLTLYPGVGHASYDIIYRDPALYTWLSQWRRGE